ncbi:MAG: hypothetical protein H0X12_05185 [Nocardioides sp.]|nr:hypothetical protein [Nocardioides sp.]
MVRTGASSQRLIGGEELGPSFPHVATLTTGDVGGDVGGEILDVHLDSGAVGGELVQGHASFLMTRMVWSPSAVSVASMACSSGLSGSSASVVRTSQWCGGSQVSTRPVPSHPLVKKCARNCPPSFDHTDPAGETSGVRECRPEVVDVGVVAALDAHGAVAIG